MAFVQGESFGAGVHPRLEVPYTEEDRPAADILAFDDDKVEAEDKSARRDGGAGRSGS